MLYYTVGHTEIYAQGENARPQAHEAVSFVEFILLILHPVRNLPDYYMP